MNTTGISGAGLSTTGGALPNRGITRSSPLTLDANPAAVQSASLDFISAVAAAPPPIDERTVRAIHSLVASGSYPINATTIAAKMIASDLMG
jgi:anti-sigma28 factor (negative regulator of flagellin synthesis)